MTQPDPQPNVPTHMGPLEIARSRLIDHAQGANDGLFDQASAVRIHNHLTDLEQRYQALRQAVARLPNALAHIDITTAAPHAIMFARVLDAIEQEVKRS